MEDGSSSPLLEVTVLAEEIKGVEERIGIEVRGIAYRP